MEESTTTEAPVESTSVEETQPVSQETEAVTTEESTQTTSEDTSSDESETTEWLSKKGIDPSSPEALAKVAEMARNAEKAMHAKAQKASDLSKQLEESPAGQVDTDNELVQQLYGEVAAVRRAQAVNDFKARTGLSDDMEQKMVNYLSDNPQTGELINAGYLTLDQLYTLAVGSDLKSVKSEGGKQALQQLANKQRAASLPGNATTSDLSGAKGDPFLDALMGKS